MDNKQSSNVNIDTVPTESPVAKKRYLTEAQKLAFLKGREKRMANIERRKQEKLEAETATKEDNEERKEKSTPVVDIKPEQVEVVPEIVPQVVESENDDEDIQAKKIADIIFERIKSQVSADLPLPDNSQSLSPPPKSRKPYIRKPKPTPRVIEEDTEEDHSTNHEPPVVPTIPKKGISWM